MVSEPARQHRMPPPCPDFWVNYRSGPQPGYNDPVLQKRYGNPGRPESRRPKKRVDEDESFNRKAFVAIIAFLILIAIIA
jgi:hypothetical protein